MRLKRCCGPARTPAASAAFAPVLPAIVLLLAATATTILLVSPAIAADSDLSAWQRLVIAIQQGQQRFHRALTDELRDIADGGGGLAAWSLVVASFLYGIFHAAGPGHGKAVLSAYLLSHREAARRGVALAFAASFCQGFVALAIVYGLVFAAGLVMNETRSAVGWTERASYALVVLLGAWLAWRGLRALRATRHANHHEASPHDHHACGHHGHAHAPTPQELSGVTPLARLGLVLSVGLRPCSGAIIVLVFAQAAQVPWAGMLAVAAMSLGTGVAVAALAFMAVHMRDRASRLGAADSRRATIIAGFVGIAGGLALGALGASLLATSFAPVHPLGL